MSTDLKRLQNFSRSQVVNINRAAEQWIIDTLAMDRRFKTMDDVGVSRNQLMGKGLKKDTIDRLYKGLYVYSKGFNELLNQCLGDENNLKGLLWKIFLILLERYNSSDYQLIVQQMIEHHFKEVKQYSQDNDVVCSYNKELQQKLQQESEKHQQEIESQLKNEESLKTQLEILHNRYLLADDAAERELEKRFRLENKTGQIRQQFNELVCKQQLLLDELQYLNKQIKQKQNQIEELIDERQSFIKKIESLSEDKSANYLYIFDLKSTIQLKVDLLKNAEDLIQKLQQQIIKQQHQNAGFVQNPFTAAKNKEFEFQQVIEEKLKLENQELRNRITMYQQQIDVYIEGKSQDMIDQINSLEQSLHQQQKYSAELQEKYLKVKQKQRNLKNQYNSLKVNQEITKGSLDIHLQKVENLESANNFQIVNNSTLSQYVERLTNCIARMEENEKILNNRINSQFQTIQQLSTQLEQVSRQNQQKLDSLNQLLLQKSIQNDELQQNYRDLKATHLAMQEHYQKEVIQQQAQNEEYKQKIQEQEIAYFHLEQKQLQLQFEIENQTKQYQEYIQKKEEQNKLITDQASQIRKLDKDNARMAQEVNWLSNQNQGFSDKIKKQQLLIKDMQKDLDQVKSDYSQAQKEFEDMKFDYDEQMIFYQQNIQSLVKQKREFEEDIVVKQQTISKQAQIMSEQNEKIKRIELNLINKEQDVKLIEERMMHESIRFNSLIANQKEETEQDKSTIISQNLQELIQKKLIQKIKLKRQQGNQNVIKIIDSLENDNSIQEIIENQLQNDSTLEQLLNTIVDGPEQKQNAQSHQQFSSTTKQNQIQQKSQTSFNKPRNNSIKPIKANVQFRQQQTIEVLPQIKNSADGTSSRTKTIKSTISKQSKVMQRSDTNQKSFSQDQQLNISHQENISYQEQSYQELTQIRSVDSEKQQSRQREKQIRQTEKQIRQSEKQMKQQSEQQQMRQSEQQIKQSEQQTKQSEQQIKLSEQQIKQSDQLQSEQQQQRQFEQQMRQSEQRFKTKQSTISDVEENESRRQTQTRFRNSSVSKSKQFSSLYRVAADYYQN